MKTKSDIVRFRLQPDLGRKLRLFASKNGVTLSTFLTLAAIQAMRDARIILDRSTETQKERANMREAVRRAMKGVSK